MTKTTSVAIVGAGPYGLSVAAHLAAAGADVKIFGTSMQTWRDSMPRGMLLKSEGFASSLSDPDRSFTLGHYCRERDIPYRDVGWPVPVEVFAAYGEAFQKRFVPQLDTRRVVHVGRTRDGFRVGTEDGETVLASRVVLATGIGPFARVPPELAGLPTTVLSHSSQHADYARFAGRRVAVIGAGASALDAAAALRRGGASATLVSRRSAVTFYEAGRPRRPIDAVLAPLTPLGPGWKKWLCCELPLLFHVLPERLRVRIVQRYLGPSPGWFVRDTIEGHVPYCLDSSVAGATLTGDGRVELSIDRSGHGRSTLEVDHVVAATGYKVDVSRLGFLAADILPEVKTVDGSPALSRDFESTVPGLHFVGTPSAYSFGPMFRFACGSDYAARRLVGHVLAREPAPHAGAGAVRRSRPMPLAPGASGG